MSSTCGACGAENREGRRFCAWCGARLQEAPVCPACGAVNEPEERFCGDCGAALTPSPSSPAAAPPSPGGIEEGERKQLTVLFADVEGSMDLQERLDPEVWAGIMGDVVRILSEGVRRFGGTVDTFTGDGIMALFGAPVAQEDHARRACHAARHLTEAVSAYAEDLRGARDVDLHVRLGLNSGEVVVGRVGDDLRLDSTALGHTVGLAQRMEVLAEPGRVWLTEHTARLVEGWFRLVDLGPMSIKGAREPLRVFMLEAPAASPPVLRGAQVLGASPLVGRERELAVLEDALAAATEGRAQVVGVVGEAGVGKTRLCEEFARSAATRGITVRRTAGVSHGGDVPLLPILALLRDYFSITEADDPAATRGKVAARLLDLDPGLEDALPLLLDLLEVPDPHRPAPQLAPEVRMRRIFEALRRVTQRRSQQEVLVLVVEDLHWFDPQSEAFLERLVESFPGSRTLVVANFRPEFTASWMRHSYYRQLALAPLGDKAVGELVAGLLGTDLTLAPLLGFVLERTGGNPFFVEEVVRTLVEDGTLAGAPGHYRLARPLHQVKVPPSVQAVLAARIDRLPAQHKAILQTAAVIGHTFAEPILARVTGLGDDAVDDGLRALCAAELIQETGDGAGAGYRFWHPLTQEVAYGTLLAAARRRLHAAVAQTIVALDPDRLDERAALVAGHYEAAGEHFDAARWHDRAANWALRTDLGEAQRRWHAAISLLADAPETPESLRLGVRARSKLLRYLARTGIEPAEADRLVEEARCMATSIHDASLSALIVAMAATTRFFRGDVAAYLDSWREVLRLADALGDATLRSFGAACVGMGTSYVGPLSEGLGAIETAGLSAVDPAVGVVEFGFSMHDVGHMLRCLLLGLAGHLDDAGRLLETTRAFYRERPAPEWEAWALSLVPRLADWTGEPDDEVAAAALEAVRVAEDSGFVAAHVTALQARGVAELLDGSPGGAAVTFDVALTEAREHGSGLNEEASLLAHLARARLAMGDERAADAGVVADEAVAVARHQGARVVECLTLLTRARVLRETGTDPAQARADLDAADRLAEETGAATYAAFLAEERARLDDDAAALAETAHRYRAIGATGHARRVEETGLKED